MYLPLEFYRKTITGQPNQWTTGRNSPARPWLMLEETDGEEALGVDGGGGARIEGVPEAKTLPVPQAICMRDRWAFLLFRSDGLFLFMAWMLDGLG